MTAMSLDATALYRLPWTLADNGISWLEPTVACNLHCDGCYRRQQPDPHKSWDEVVGELDTFQSLRRCDCISIAGGDPLLYPRIVDLVAEIHGRGLKAIVNTNGVALTEELLADLARAGVYGFTFHVDSRQGRGEPWTGKTETELNDLRLHYAEMLARVGGIACSFNATVYGENLHEVPAMLDWAHRHIDIVQTMVFICFRHIVPEMPFDWYAGSEPVPWERVWYSTQESGREVEIDARTLVERAREQDSRFRPAAFLNGTHDPQACKWLLALRVGDRETIDGYLGPRFVEAVTDAYHLCRGRYLAYVSPRQTRHGKAAMLVSSAFDREARRAWRRFLGSTVRRPARWLRPVSMQSIMFIQPVNFLADGEQSMCDGCPDVTVHEGKLVWSCRLEELKQYGTFLRTCPRNRPSELPAGIRTLPQGRRQQRMEQPRQQGRARQ
jgi:MoaA/NifB/PqqE/SkfB family radical SAM enzyme